MVSPTSHHVYVKPVARIRSKADYQRDGYADLARSAHKQSLAQPKRVRSAGRSKESVTGRFEEEKTTMRLSRRERRHGRYSREPQRGAPGHTPRQRAHGGISQRDERAQAADMIGDERSWTIAPIKTPVSDHRNEERKSPRAATKASRTPRYKSTTSSSVYAALDDNLAVLEAINEQLQAPARPEKKQLYELTRSYSQARYDTQSILTTLNPFFDQCTTKKQTIEKGEDTLENLSQSVAKLDTELSKFKSNIKDDEQLIEKFQAQMDEIAKQKREAEGRKQDSTNKMNRIVSQLGQAESEIGEARRSIDRLSRQYNDMSARKSRIEQRTHAIDELNQRVLDTFKEHMASYEAGWKGWKRADVLDWITHIDGMAYAKYTTRLRKAFERESITGADMEAFTNGDLSSWGVDSFQDRHAILKRISRLVDEDHGTEEEHDASPNLDNWLEDVGMTPYAKKLKGMGMTSVSDYQDLERDEVEDICTTLQMNFASRKIFRKAIECLHSGELPTSYTPEIEQEDAEF